MQATVTGADGKARCWWGGDDPLYRAYHDAEWGRPIHDERMLFELLCLEGFQAGLAWITILRKRDAFRAAFGGFDPSLMAGYSEGDVARLMSDPGIVRNRAKIEAVIGNARALVAMHARGESLDELAWSYAPPRDRGGAPAPSPISRPRPPPPSSCRRHSRRAASGSSAPPSSMPSCSRPGSSTITLPRL